MGPFNCPLANYLSFQWRLLLLLLLQSESSQSTLVRGRIEVVKWGVFQLLFRQARPCPEVLLWLAVLH